MSWSSPAVQVGGAASSGQVANLTATFGSGVATGDVVVVVCNLFSGASTPLTVAVSDQDGNTYTLHSKATQQDGGGPSYETWAVYYLAVPSASNGHALAVKITPSATTFCNMGIAEFGTGGATPVPDAAIVTQAQTASFSAPATPSISVAGSGPDLIIAGAETNATSGHDVAVGSGFTQIFQNNYVPGTSLGACFQYKLNVTSAGTAAFGGTTAGADRWNVGGVSFRLLMPPQPPSPCLSFIETIPPQYED